MKGEGATPEGAPTRAARKKTRRPKPVLGWREWLSLPELGVKSVKAKVDTGARSSSLHIDELELFERDGQSYVRFWMDCARSAAKLETFDSRPIEVPLYDERWITSSNGQRQRRPVIRTLVCLFGQSWEVDLSLTPRGAMEFPMLLGREAIRRRFVVDPARSFLATRVKTKAP